MNNIISTGQKDIEGREIYEGDIVEFNPIGSTSVERGRIWREEDGWCILVEGMKSNKRYGFDKKYGFQVFGKPRIIERKSIKCERCGYEVAKYREQWQKTLCRQCNLDYDSPSQEELEQRI